MNYNLYIKEVINDAEVERLFDILKAKRTNYECN